MMRIRGRGRDWSPEELAELDRFVAANQGFGMVQRAANHLGRSYKSVSAKIIARERQEKVAPEQKAACPARICPCGVRVINSDITDYRRCDRCRNPDSGARLLCSTASSINGAKWTPRRLGAS